LAVAYFYMQNLFPIVPDMVVDMTEDLFQLVDALAP
jgi:hypothetical protein